MKNFLAVLMDTLLISLFILLSSNYPESLPHYNPNTFPTLRIGSHGWTSINGNAPDNSGAKNLKPTSINFDQIDSKGFTNIPVGLKPALLFQAPANTESNTEPLTGNSYASMFPTTLIYLIVNETSRSGLESD